MLHLSRPTDFIFGWVIQNSVAINQILDILVTHDTTSQKFIENLVILCLNSLD